VKDSGASVVLVGPPNSGKSSLFNWLTGRRQKVVNYPGSTVDYAQGPILPVYGVPDLEAIDTPGTYSLDPKSPEEAVTVELLRSPKGTISAIVLVVDATQGELQVGLVDEIKRLGPPVVLALSMADLLPTEVVDRRVDWFRSRFSLPVVVIDGRLGGGIKDLLRTVGGHTLHGQERSQQGLADHGTSLPWPRFEAGVRQTTDRIDRWVLHPVLGLSFFILTMAALFGAIFWLAAPLMDLVDAAFSSIVQTLHATLPGSLGTEFLAEGIVGSLGAVLVFVPQILVLFLLLAVLEESGYLARAAALVDRPLRAFGLSGRSFVPLLSGFACAVPAVLAARTLSSSRMRWLTVMIIPFMTCSARLPVYALLLGFLFAGQNPFWAGLTLAGLYVGALVFSLVSARLLTKILRTEDDDLFVLELPVYRRPEVGKVLRKSWLSTKHYITKSAPTIFAMAVLVWVLTTFPRSDLDGAERLNGSFAGRIGQKLEFMVEPMGGDWRVGLGLVSAFAAREVFVSTLAIVMNADPESETQSLLERMREATRADGAPLFTVASTAALLVFFMLALQCMSTVGVVYREMGSWKYALGQLVGMNTLAYVLACAVFALVSVLT
jgi:ferrous iron transport protein B